MNLPARLHRKPAYWSPRPLDDIVRAVEIIAEVSGVRPPRWWRG